MRLRVSKSEVLFVEEFLREDGTIEEIERCRLPVKKWRGIRDDVAWDFNQRLKAKKLPQIRWSKETRLERLLGKECLVLAWAVELAEMDQIPRAIRNWLGLRPEERWWLYHITAAATGGVGDGEIGWRKALRYALSENPDR